MNYFIGMDGGGTNTIAVIGNENDILYELKGLPSNYHNVGVEAAQTAIHSLITQLCEKANIDVLDVTSICFGGAGVDTPSDEKIVKQLFKNMGYEGVLKVVNDSEIALVAANGKCEGALLISGTGSIAIGAQSGKLHRVGGWGQVIGDEGSGYTIGRDALVAIAKASDGRLTPNGLFDAIKDGLNFETPEDIIQFVYGQGNGKDAIAALAPLVIEASKRDQTAKDLLTRNARELVEHIEALVMKMGHSTFVLSVSGSVLMKSDVYYELFKKAINLKWPEILVQRTSVAPVVGAYQMAIDLYKENMK